MATSFSSLLLQILLFFSVFTLLKPTSALSSPYLSPATFLPNYNQMFSNFKIFVYESTRNQTFSTPIESIFNRYLLKSPFLTSDPTGADLFYLSLPSQNPRSIARSIRALRTEFPYWNRTLGADHFFISCDGVGINSDRNLVELKKNSIQISCFPAVQGKFIPHKDLTLPTASRDLPSRTRTEKILGFYSAEEEDRSISTLLNELKQDPDFLIESKPLESSVLADRLSSSKFCLFFYGFGSFPVGEALRFGCVPVVISDRPIVDLPFSDVLRWTEIALFVRMGEGREVKGVLERTSGKRYEKMRELGKMASVHFVWEDGYKYGASYTVLYQLWMRRHTIRYASWELK